MSLLSPAITCDKNVPNADMSLCDNTPGRSCTIKCREGFEPANDVAVCLEKGIWSIDVNSFCKRKFTIHKIYVLMKLVINIVTIIIYIWQIRQLCFDHFAVLNKHYIA